MTSIPPKKRRAFPKRDPGAQPANTNAQKHGIYARRYTPEELAALDRDVSGSLKDEMEILRLIIAETADSVLEQPEADMPFLDHVSALRTIAVSIARLENVIHTRMAAFGDPDGREKQVNAVLDGLEEAEMERLLPGGTPKRGRGAPPGNLNAWKHGFYARVFTPAEKERLQGGEVDQLRHEETLLRVLILRVWRSLRSVRSIITYHEYLFTTRSICYAVFVIAKLQRARRCLFGDQTDLEKDIQVGISEACADLGVLDYLKGQLKK